MSRLIIQEDGEGYEGILHAIERLGSRLSKGTRTGLAQYEPYLRYVALQTRPSVLHTPDRSTAESRFIELFKVVRMARNLAMHHGSVARNLAEKLVELSISIEDGLMTEDRKVEHLMVKDPTCAMLWHTIDHIRFLMLSGSFSALPIKDESGSWKLLLDSAIASYQVRTPRNHVSTATALGDCLLSKAIELNDAGTCAPGVSETEAIENLSGKHALLILDKHNNLLGILTYFDLL